MAESQPVEIVENVMSTVIAAMGVSADIDVREEDDVIHGEFVGSDVAVVIGHHGATLDAIQQLAQRIAFRGRDERKPVVVDAAGYRARRAAALEAIADQAAEAALRDGRPVPLEAMGPQERKVVHEHLKANFQVETYSEGQEPNRRLIVAPLMASGS